MLTAKDIMTKNVVTVTPGTSLDQLAAVLLKSDISGAPVVDDQGALIGIVTENDLISRDQRLHIPTVVSFLGGALYLESSRKFEQEIQRLTATKVGEICTSAVTTIPETATITEIATIMAEKNVHLLPVLKDGALVGIVGKRDMVKAIATRTE